jgi:hypothetical protein
LSATEILGGGGDGEPVDKMSWRMPPLAELSTPTIAGVRKWGLVSMRSYLGVAMILVIVKIVMLAVH